MPEVFFTADHHFGHANILKYESDTRPFSTIEEHDEVLIERWNAVVKPKDTVWHLGDVAFGQKGLERVKALNGVKKLVLGNHDHLSTQSYLRFFNKVYGVLKWKHNMVLSHVPLHPCQFDYRFELNLHGHLHSSVLDDPRYIDVGVDKWDLAPVSWEVIKHKLDESKG